MATIAALAGAAISAYGANRQASAQKAAAKAAGKPTTTTTTQTPWLMDYGMKDKAQYLLDQQQQIYDNTSGAAAAAAQPAAPKKGKNADANQAAWDAYVKGGKQGDWNAFKTSFQPSSAGGATPTNTGGGKAPVKRDANGIFNEVANRAFDAQQNDPSIKMGNEYANKVLNSDDFSGTNKISQDLYNRLNGANFDRSVDLLKQFMGDDIGMNGGGGASGGGKNVRVGYQKGTAQAMAAQPGGGGGGYKMVTNAAGQQVMVPAHIAAAEEMYGGGKMPDTVGGQDTFFAKQVQNLFDPARFNPEDDPTLKPYIEAMKADALDAFNQERGRVDAMAEGRGRFGGGLYSNLSAQNQANAQRVLDANLAGTYIGARKDLMDRQQNALGMTNARDMALLGDNTQRWSTMIGDSTNRYGIDAQRDAANAGAGAAAAAAQGQLDLARRGQNLDAIMGIMKQDQFGLGQLGDLGKQLDAKQTAAYGGLPALAGANADYLNTANNAGQGMASYDIGRRNAANAGAGAKLANQQFAWQQQVYNNDRQQNALNDYLRTLGAIGGMGGTSVQTGTGQPMQAPNVGAATAMGAMGGAMAGYGMFSNLGGGGGSGAAYLGAGQQSYMPSQLGSYQAPVNMPSNLGYQPSSMTIN